MSRILNFKLKIKNSQSAFTLIEAIVSTAVFAFVIVSIMGVFLSTVQLDRKSRAQRAVSQNARFIMEYLAKEVRNGTIDYTSYGAVSGTDHLYLENQANIREHMYLSGTDMVLDKGGATTNLNSEAVKVTKLKFYIQPIANPFTTAKTYNEQPRVTVVMELTSDYGSNVAEKTVMNLQDTYVIRNYPSRQTAAVGQTVENVTWTNVVGVSVGAGDNSLTKPGPNAWDAGASSVQSITSGDGYVEFSTNETNMHKLAGLGKTDTTVNPGSIYFAIYTFDGGSLYIYENGGTWPSIQPGSYNEFPVGTYVAGDTLRVAVESGVVKYYKNGTLLYTSTRTPTYPLFLNASLHNQNSTITNGRISH